MLEKWLQKKNRKFFRMILSRRETNKERVRENWALR